MLDGDLLEGHAHAPQLSEQFGIDGRPACSDVGYAHSSAGQELECAIDVAHAVQAKNNLDSLLPAPRVQLPQERIGPPLAVAQNSRVRMLSLALQELRQIFRIKLTVAVHETEQLAVRGREAREQSGSVALIRRV